MEFLVEFAVEVPAGTPDEQVEQHQRAESAAAAKLAEDGHLVRLRRRPLLGDGTTAIGLYRAFSQARLEDLLAALPLADRLRVTVTPLRTGPPIYFSIELPIYRTRGHPMLNDLRARVRL